MDEQEFDALFSARPFGTQDAMRLDARWGRCGTLGTLLFGRTPDELRRQLLASHPEIPPGTIWPTSATCNATWRWSLAL